MSSKDIIRIGRFKEKMSEDAISYTSSFLIDRRIFNADILVNKAHAIMLAEKKIISKAVTSKILKVLEDLEDKGFEALDTTSEDIHIAVEKYLIEKLGEDVGGRIHTGRSRNDLVSTDLRIALRAELNLISESLIKLQKVLLDLAAENVETVTLGYTHLQHAQPITFAHYLISYVDAFGRDLARLDQAYLNVNKSPLGAAAIATTGFPIDRKRTAELLGFNSLIENSLDAVTSRDFLVETLSALGTLMINVGRLAEEIILWSTYEFGMIELAEEYSSTSSIMPQKKNPDVAELIRAKTGRVLGDLTGAFMILKAVPTSYNRDFQELTPLLWDAVDVVKSTLPILANMLSTMTIKKERMIQLASSNFSTATELADTIVREKNLPFRTAHTIVGKAVAKAIESCKTPAEINSELIDEVARDVIGKSLGLSNKTVQAALDPKKFVEKRSIIGGPAPREVLHSLKIHKKIIAQSEKILQEHKQVLLKANTILNKAIKLLSS